MVLLSSFNYLIAAFLSVSQAAVLRRESQDPQASVLYFIANNNTQNAVIAIPVGRDGKLLRNGATVTPTGGLGGSILDMQTLQPFTPDSLNSQNSIVREREVGKLKMWTNQEESSLITVSLLVPFHRKCWI